MARELTMDEVREEFFKLIADRCVDVILNEAQSKARAVELAVFAVLSTLEGSSDFPICGVIPQQHPDNQAWLREQGENWYPSPPVEQEAMDMSLLRGEDHHQFVEALRARFRSWPDD